MMMTALEMIKEWRRGCSVAIHGQHEPEYCPECTRCLIEALERRLTEESICTGNAPEKTA